MIARALLLTATIAIAAPHSAEAQLKKAPALTGSWGFQTEKMGYGCALSGDMTITQTAEKSYKCSFKAVWACELRLPKAVHTEQSCIATQTGYDVLITSKMERIAKVDPTEMLEAMQRRYAADHFNVRINWRGDEMDGIFKSYGQAPVKFRKRLDLVG